MFWIVLYLTITVGFLLWWKAIHYKTPDEQARDIEEEAKYWRDRTKENRQNKGI